MSSAPEKGPINEATLNRAIRDAKSQKSKIVEVGAKTHHIYPAINEILFDEHRTLSKLKTVMNTVPRRNIDRKSRSKIWFADGHDFGTFTEPNCRLLLKLMDDKLKTNQQAYTMSRLIEMDNQRPTLPVQ